MTSVSSREFNFIKPTKEMLVLIEGLIEFINKRDDGTGRLTNGWVSLVLNDEIIKDKMYPPHVINFMIKLMHANDIVYISHYAEKEIMAMSSKMSWRDYESAFFHYDVRHRTVIPDKLFVPFENDPIWKTRRSYEIHKKTCTCPA